MIRYRFIIAIVLGLMLSVSGCGQGVKQVAAEESITDYETESVVEEAEGSDSVKGDNTADTEEDTMTGSEGYKKALVFMIEKYGFTVEELLGLDVEALIADYRLDSEDYTKEEIAEIIEDQREYYLLNPADEIFSILGNPDDVPAISSDLPENADIAKIAMYINSGSLQRRVLFDLEDELYYVNDGTPYVLEPEEADKLKAVLKEAGVSSWEHVYEKDGEPETTGSLGWKLVIVLKDQTECVYGGYTRDMSNLPDGFDQVDTVFSEIAKSL